MIPFAHSLVSGYYSAVALLRAETWCHSVCCQMLDEGDSQVAIHGLQPHFSFGFPSAAGLPHTPPSPPVRVQSTRDGEQSACATAR